MPTIVTLIAATPSHSIDDAQTIVEEVVAVLVVASAMVAIQVDAVEDVAVVAAVAASDRRRALLQGGLGLLHVMLPRPKLL